MTPDDEFNAEVQSTDTPAVDPGSMVDEVPLTRWPKVFGVFSIVYAILGLCCFSLQGVWLGLMDLIPEMFRGGITMPLPLRLTLIGLIIPVIVLGFMLLTGGIGLVRRKRSSLGLLKKWVILRLVMLLIGVVVTVLTAPAQIQIQKQAHEFQSRMMAQSGRTPKPLPSDDQIWHGLLIQTGIFSGLIAIYPFTLGMYLSRKKIAEEVAEWR